MCSVAARSRCERLLVASRSSANKLLLLLGFSRCCESLQIALEAATAAARGFLVDMLLSSDGERGSQVLQIDIAMPFFPSFSGLVN
jgi:hypothetical protein